jgi:hypothetical protein
MAKSVPAVMVTTIAIRDNADGLDSSKRYGNEPRVLIDFFASVFAFLLKFLQFRKYYLKQLKNDGCIDIRIKSQSQYGKIDKCAAGKYIQES